MNEIFSTSMYRTLEQSVQKSTVLIVSYRASKNDSILRRPHIS